MAATWLKAHTSLFRGRPREGVLATHEASNLPRLRSGLRRGAPCLREGRGGLRSGVPTEARRNFQPAGVPEGPLATALHVSVRGVALVITPSSTITTKEASEA